MYKFIYIYMNELINDNGHFTYFGKNLLIYNSKFKINK